MSNDKIRAVFVGVFILVAYGVLASALTQAKIVILLADVISGLAVIGIAVLMYPLFKHVNRPVAIGYLVLKYAEGLLMILAGLLFLGAAGSAQRDMIYNGAQVYVFIVSGFMFYYLLYRSKLVPGYISIWGAAGILALTVSTALNAANIHFAPIEYLLVLIITNEIFLALWLMIKGFKGTMLDQIKLSSAIK